MGERSSAAPGDDLTASPAPAAVCIGSPDPGRGALPARAVGAWPSCLLVVLALIRVRAMLPAAPPAAFQSGLSRSNLRCLVLAPHIWTLASARAVPMHATQIPPAMQHAELAVLGLPFPLAVPGHAVQRSPRHPHARATTRCFGRTINPNAVIISSSAINPNAVITSISVGGRGWARGRARGRARGLRGAGRWRGREGGECSLDGGAGGARNGDGVQPALGPGRRGGAGVKSSSAGRWQARGRRGAGRWRARVGLWRARGHVRRIAES